MCFENKKIKNERVEEVMKVERNVNKMPYKQLRYPKESLSVGNFTFREEK